MRFGLLFLALILITTSASALTERELDSIGRRVWENECRGTREGLTSWNKGEDFASLGIGHFIWYPKGVRGPFEESFPKLVRFLDANGVRVPGWLKPDAPCPWSSREEFLAAFHGAKMTELRDMLAGSVHVQARFLAQRMEAALPKMLEAAPAGDRAKVKANFEALARTGAGTFALIDYVNFKGEGTKETERYRGEGWGLLQVLSGMRAPGSDASAAFTESAVDVLTRRVRNAPPERHEERWLEGWKSRVRAYAR